jgi:hypothetical protein
MAAPAGVRTYTGTSTGKGTRPVSTAPRTPAEHHYDLAESGLADLGRVGFDDAGRTVEVLVALTHATLAIAAILATEDNHGRP